MPDSSKSKLLDSLKFIGSCVGLVSLAALKTTIVSPIKFIIGDGGGIVGVKIQKLNNAVNIGIGKSTSVIKSTNAFKTINGSRPVTKAKELYSTASDKVNSAVSSIKEKIPEPISKAPEAISKKMKSFFDNHQKISNRLKTIGKIVGITMLFLLFILAPHVGAPVIATIAAVDFIKTIATSMKKPSSQQGQEHQQEQGQEHQQEQGQEHQQEQEQEQELHQQTTVTQQTALPEAAAAAAATAGSELTNSGVAEANNTNTIPNSTPAIQNNQQGAAAQR